MSSFLNSDFFSGSGFPPGWDVFGHSTGPLSLTLSSQLAIPPHRKILKNALLSFPIIPGLLISRVKAKLSSQFSKLTDMMTSCRSLGFPRVAFRSPSSGFRPHWISFIQARRSAKSLKLSQVGAIFSPQYFAPAARFAGQFLHFLTTSTD
mgnify:CR=1 FL=1